MYFAGNYSCLVAEFHLHRSIGFHLIQSYLPSILIVAISWVSFWMDVDCVPARVTLGVITLLTVSSQVSGKKILQYQKVHLEKLFFQQNFCSVERIFWIFFLLHTVYFLKLTFFFVLQAHQSLKLPTLR